MSESKNHHYVPQWLMKSWADENDRVICVNRQNPPTIKNFVTHVRNVNSQNRLYTLEAEDGKKHDKLETGIYGPLDVAAKNLTDQLCQILDSRQIPEMDFESRKLLWQFFYYNAFKRLPGSFDEYLKKLDYEEIREKTIQSALEDGEDEEDIRRITKSFDVKALVEQRGIQYVRAEQNDDVLNIFANFGIIFAIAVEGASFILPDRSIVIQRANLQEPPKEHWIPIHPKYAFRGITPSTEITLVQMNKRAVRRLNENWYTNANMVISTSKRQAMSLVKRHDRQRIEFH